MHVYVDDVADAYEKHIYADVITDTDAIATVQMYFQMHVHIRTPKICKCKSNIATHMHLPWLAVSIRQAALPVACLVRICLQFIRASIHGKKNELNTEIYRNLVFSSEGIKG